MSKIKWNLPGPDDPGFLRRRGELIPLVDAEPSPESHAALIEYLSGFVEDPETLLDCSKREYGKAVLSILGYGHEVPDPKGASSGQL